MNDKKTFVSVVPLGTEEWGGKYEDVAKLITSSEHGIFERQMGRLIGTWVWDFGSSFAKALSLTISGLSDVANAVKNFNIAVTELERTERYRRRYENRGRAMARRKAGRRV